MSNRIVKRGLDQSVLVCRTLDAGQFRYVAEVPKPARFDNAAKDCLATMYAPVDRFIVCSNEHSSNRFGGGFSSSMVMTHYEVANDGKWVVVKRGRYTHR